MPKLSIIMPTYNGERFLAEQVDSILAQDDDDFEFLIVDDGSTDGTRGLTDAYAARDSRIRVIPATGNLGQNARLAQMIGEAQGQYLAIADQDDRWAPDRNRRLFAALLDRPMAMARSELIDGDGRRHGRSLLEAMGVEIGAEFRLRALLGPMFSAHAMLGERRCFSPNVFGSPLPFDRLWGLEALFGGGLAYVDEAVTFHRLHGGNQMNRLEAGGSRLTPSYLRWVMLFRRGERVRLWLTLDFLGRADIDADTRRLFANLAGRCWTTWFSEWRALHASSALGDELKTALLPFGDGEHDRAEFARQVDLLTASGASGTMFREIRRRYRG